MKIEQEEAKWRIYLRRKIKRELNICTLNIYNTNELEDLAKEYKTIPNYIKELI